jgi:hypothetical protein
MTAAALLDRCRTLGIHLAAGPDGALSWESDTDPPTLLLADLAQHKADLLALLGSAAAEPAGLCPTDRAWAAQVIEADLGLPAGRVEVGPWLMSCPGCPHCRARTSGTGEPP